ncbi:MAG: hypothetical protein HDS04_05075 [Bacteroides sp.]|nr:hypothetical protein [Bacteroides sp.]
MFKLKPKKNRLLHFLSEESKLNKDEIYLIQKKWGGVVKNLTPGYVYYRGLKALDCFDANYLSSAYFYPYIERILNPAKYKFNLGHKAMLELVYGDIIAHPKTLLRSYGGVMFNEEYHAIRKSDAIRIIRAAEQPLLYKPAVDSAQGDGIRKFDVSEFDELCKLIDSNRLGQTDFVLQYLVEQSLDTKVFNPTSLNCMRITTLNLNGHITICSRAIKCGPQNSVVDNIGSGRRGVIVGIHPDGSLCERGFYGNGEIATEHNGVRFQDYKINHFHVVEDAAYRLHQIVPSCKIIGWDIALDYNNNPILIEGNTNYPGISLEQMCSGPIFGERTDEVIDYVRLYL